MRPEHSAGRSLSLPLRAHTSEGGRATGRGNPRLPGQKLRAQPSSWKSARDYRTDPACWATSLSLSSESGAGRDSRKRHQRGQQPGALSRCLRTELTPTVLISTSGNGWNERAPRVQMQVELACALSCCLLWGLLGQG